jgi:dipeptidase D
VQEFEQTLRREYKSTETSITLGASRGTGEARDMELPSGEAATLEDTLKAVSLMLALPHGIAAMSADIKGLVETSNNFATFAVKNRELTILSSQRSSFMSKLDELTWRIEAAAALAGARAETSGGYPSWPANMDSPLLKRCREIYRGLSGREPVVEIIHAGLECAVLGRTFPDMDMLSLGPTIKNPHSPDERLFIPSVIQVWELLQAILKSYKP